MLAETPLSNLLLDADASVQRAVYAVGSRKKRVVESQLTLSLKLSLVVIMPLYEPRSGSITGALIGLSLINRVRSTASGMQRSYRAIVRARGRRTG